MCQLVPVGTDLTGASGSLWALCNTWAIALVQPLVPPLGQQEVVPTGVDGALCISLGNTSPSAGNALLESGLHHPQVDMNGI